MLYKNLSVNDAGHLCFAGFDTTLLAQEYGTALMLMDEGAIRSPAFLPAPLQYGPICRGNRLRSNEITNADNRLF